MPTPIPQITNIELVELLANGYLVKEISDITETNIRTVESRIKKLMCTTNTKTAAHLVAKYCKLGLITVQ